jgi:ribosomal protein S18 acetylase RimI-like enzyme
VNSLSNAILASSVSGELIYRLGTKAEMLPALRWLLGRARAPATEAQAMEFLRLAFQRGIDPARMWIASAHDRLVWAILPVPSPGRTVLLFSPGDYDTREQAVAAKKLTQKILDHYAADIHLAQVLFEPSDQRMIDLYAEQGFVRLAELIYMQTTPRKNYAFPALPSGMRLLTYSQDTHALFSTAIERSYLDSLDCPGLAGLRKMEEVLAGHKAAGEFDPETWFVIVDDTNPVGVVLLNALPANQTLELVYLGVAPMARRRGVGQFLFRHALAVTSRSAFPRLNFAVDSGNRPALNLYYRHGMQRIGSKIAMLRDLRK